MENDWGITFEVHEYVVMNHIVDSLVNNLANNDLFNLDHN